MHLSMFPSDGVGTGLPPEIRRFQKFGVFRVPTHVYVKNPQKVP